MTYRHRQGARNWLIWLGAEAIPYINFKKGQVERTRINQLQTFANSDVLLHGWAGRAKIPLFDHKKPQLRPGSVFFWATKHNWRRIRFDPWQSDRFPWLTRLWETTLGTIAKVPSHPTREWRSKTGGLQNGVPQPRGILMDMRVTFLQ